MRKKVGSDNLGAGSRSLNNALTLSQKLTALQRQVHEQEKKIRQLKELNEFLEEVGVFSPPAVRSQQRTKAEIYCTKETSDGKRHRKIAFYGSALSVIRQGFYKYLARRSRPWKLWRVGKGGYTGNFYRGPVQ